MNTKNRTIMIILMAILMIVALIGLRLKNDKSIIFRYYKICY